MPENTDPIISICGCGRPVKTDPHLAGELPNEPRHFQVAGEPVACPE
ncbi:hypothetical protein AB0469_31765 [Streptomyces sp. NPDC093801]